MLAALGAAAVLAVGLVTGTPWLTALVAALAAVAVSSAVQVSRPGLVRSVPGAVASLVLGTVAATSVVASVQTPGPGLAYPLLALVALVVVQALAHGRLGSRDVVVVGCGAEGRRAAERYLGHPGLGVRPVGFLAADGDRLRDLPLPLLGRVEDAARATRETGASVLVLTGEVAVLGPPGVETYTADGTPVRIQPRTAPARLLGFAERVVALLLLLPAAGVLAVLVRIETGGVIERTHEADGRRSSRFRTRRARNLDRPGTTWHVEVSGRSGPVGRLLRRTGWDVLPELVARVAGRRRPRPAPVRSAGPTSPHQAKVDVGQLTR